MQTGQRVSAGRRFETFKPAAQMFAIPQRAISMTKKSRQVGQIRCAGLTVGRVILNAPLGTHVLRAPSRVGDNAPYLRTIFTTPSDSVFGLCVGTVYHVNR